MRIRKVKQSLPFQFKADTDRRIVSGYASVFDVLDSYGEVVRRGAFEETLERRFRKERRIKMLWQHRPDLPIGIPVDMSEDSKGLWVSGKVSRTRLGDEVLRLISDEVVDSFSIGYEELKASEFEDDELRATLTGWAANFPLRNLLKLKLYEFSPVTFPANEEARILAVKSALVTGWTPELEQSPSWSFVKFPTSPRRKELVPSADMTDEEKRESLEQRSERYGIEIREDASLTFPTGFPTDLDLYGDPVNLKYPVDTVERARNARVRFKQNADEYSETSSKRIVHNRIVEAELDLGVVPSYDPDDSLDDLLDEDVVRRIEEASDTEEASDGKPEEKWNVALIDTLSDERLLQTYRGVEDWKEELLGNLYTVLTARSSVVAEMQSRGLERSLRPPRSAPAGLDSPSENAPSSAEETGTSKTALDEALGNKQDPPKIGDFVSWEGGQGRVTAIDEENEVAVVQVYDGETPTDDVEEVPFSDLSVVDNPVPEPDMEESNKSERVESVVRMLEAMAG